MLAAGSLRRGADAAARGPAAAQRWQRVARGAPCTGNADTRRPLLRACRGHDKAGYLRLPVRCRAPGLGAWPRSGGVERPVAWPRHKGACRRGTWDKVELVALRLSDRRRPARSPAAPDHCFRHSPPTCGLRGRDKRQGVGRDTLTMLGALAAAAARRRGAAAAAAALGASRALSAAAASGSAGAVPSSVVDQMIGYARKEVGRTCTRAGAGPVQPLCRRSRPRNAAASTARAAATKHHPLTAAHPLTHAGRRRGGRRGALGAGDAAGPCRRRRCVAAAPGNGGAERQPGRLGELICHLGPHACDSLLSTVLTRVAYHFA